VHTNKIIKLNHSSMESADMILIVVTGETGLACILYVNALKTVHYNTVKTHSTLKMPERNIWYY